MQFFKKRKNIEKILLGLIAINYLFFIYYLFSPSLPKLKISVDNLTGELFLSLTVLALFYAFLKKNKLAKIIKSEQFKKIVFLFLGILFLLILTRIPYIINHQSLLNADKSVTLLMVKNISKGISSPIYFYGQLYQGSLNAYVYSLIHSLIPSLKISVLAGNLIVFSLFILVGALLINKITDHSSFFYPVIIMTLSLSGMIFFSNDETRGISFIVFFEILLIYLAYQVIFEKKGNFFTAGFIAGILFWIYQPSTSIILITCLWMLLSLLYQHRTNIIPKFFGFLSFGFLLGSLPHILGEVNNSFINTKVLFLSRGFFGNLNALNKDSILNILNATIMNLDKSTVVSYILSLIFIAGFTISVFLAVKRKDVKKIYLPLLFLLNLFFLIASRYPPIPRFIVHYKIYSYLVILIGILFFKELKLFHKKSFKYLLILMFIGITLWKTIERFPVLHAAHIKNKKDIAALNAVDDKIILGNYWHTVRLAPFLSEEKVITTTPTIVKPEGVFSYSKYYPLALKLGDMWRSRNKTFLSTSGKSQKINEILGDFNLNYLQKDLPSGKYTLYSNFSKNPSPALFDLLNSNLNKRYFTNKQSDFLYLKEKLSKVPDLVIKERNIILPCPLRGFQKVNKKAYKDWRYVLKREDFQISFPLDFSNGDISYKLPKTITFENGTYKNYVSYLNMPVIDCGEIEFKENDENNKFIISDLRDVSYFVTIQEEKQKSKRGLPLNHLKLKILDKTITTVELHIYSFFNFESSIWTKRYDQILTINKHKYTLKHGENRIIYEITDKKNIHMNTKYKTLLTARDLRGNFTFPNTGAILEKITLHSPYFTFTTRPFLKINQ